MGVLRRPTLLTSPLFGSSILLLIVNDHVFKQAWPGVVTGKLSDVAGVLMVAIALTAVVGNSSAASLATAAGFGLLKTVPMVARWSAPVLGGVTRTDPSDLFALLALVPLTWCLHARAPAAASRSTHGRAVVQLVFVGAAVFATTATSCRTEGVDSIASHNGVLLATATDHVYLSTDGGSTWRQWPVGVRIGLQEREVLTNVCVDGVCVKVDQATSRIIERRGTIEKPVLELDPAQLAQLNKLGNPDCICSAFDSVAAINVHGTLHVVVSMGPAGALHRNADGTWEWVRIGRWGVPGNPGDTYFGLPIGGAGR